MEVVGYNMTIEYAGAKRLIGLKSDRVTDGLGSAVDGTITGATLDTTNKKLGTGCYDFDGVDDKVTAMGTASDWKFLHDGSPNTVSFWIRRNGGQDVSEPCILDTQGASASNTGLSIWFSTTGIIYTMVSNGAGSVKGNTGISTTDLTWHHIVMVRDSSNLYHYKDNVLVETVSLSGHTPSTGNSSFPLGFGINQRSPPRYIDAQLDDVGIWNRALTASEISALYNSGTGALVSSLTDTSGLKAYYNFDSTTGGLVNQASSTSSLDALTGVDTNTLFLQKDDTSKIFWFDGSAWI